jgi:Uncharacterized protein conserved in bacteria (DUF2213)
MTKPEDVVKSVVANAKQVPKRLFGLHFYPGVAQYPEHGNEKLYLNEATLRQMDPTFTGCPVFVMHTDLDLQDAIKDMSRWDGVVVRSFYNEADGKHWAEFLAMSDAAQDAVRRGWRLSNAYTPEVMAGSGDCNGVPYDKKVVKAKFEHLALVPDPRYQDSVVLTPEEFRAYNDRQTAELRRVANSKSPRKQLFNLFKTSKVENSEEIGNISVTLKSGRTFTVADLIANAEAEADREEKVEKSKEAPKAEEAKQGDKPEAEHSAPQMANMDHMVEVGGKKMSVRDCMANHAKMQGYMDAMSEHHAELMKKDSADEDGGEKDAKAAQEADDTARNADEDGGEKEADEQLKVSDKTKRNDAKKGDNFKALKNAPKTQADDFPVDFMDRVELGRQRYGSKDSN